MLRLNMKANITLALALHCLIQLLIKELIRQLLQLKTSQIRELQIANLFTLYTRH